jgi:predicted MFS family arabinose efflux permease
MSQSPRLRSPLLVECMIYLAISTPLGLFGAAWPQQREQFGQSSGALGLLILAYGIGRLSTAATALPILRRVHIRVANTVLCLLFVVADLVAGFGQNFVMLIVCFAVIGLLTGALDSLGARFQTLVRNVGSAGLMFGCYGLGAALGPAVSAVFSWTAGFVLAALLALVAALLAVRPQVDWPVALVEPRHKHKVPAAEIPPVPLVLSLLAVAGFCALEATSANWSATYLEGARGASAVAASLAVSGFWAGITCGRLFLGRVPWPPSRILSVAGLSVLVTLVLIPLVPTRLAMFGFVVLGLALAGIFPTLLSTTADRVGHTAAGKVSGWQLLTANLAATCVSALMGVLVIRFGPQVIIFVLMGVSLCALPVLVLCTRLHSPDAQVVSLQQVTGPEHAP